MVYITQYCDILDLLVVEGYSKKVFEYPPFNYLARPYVYFPLSLAVAISLEADEKVLLGVA